MPDRSLTWSNRRHSYGLLKPYAFINILKSSPSCRAWTPISLDRQAVKRFCRVRKWRGRQSIVALGSLRIGNEIESVRRAND